MPGCPGATASQGLAPVCPCHLPSPGRQTPGVAIPLALARPSFRPGLAASSLVLRPRGAVATAGASCTRTLQDLTLQRGTSKGPEALVLPTGPRAV